MLRLLPAACARPASPAREATPRPAAPARGLVYTLLRHGQGLSPEECARRLARLTPLSAQDDGPFQAA